MSGLPQRGRLRKRRAERGRDEGLAVCCVALWLGSLGIHWPLAVFTLRLRMMLDSRSLTWERTVTRGRILSWNPFKIPLRRRFAVDAEGGRVVLPSKAPHTAMYCRLVLAEKAWEGIQVETRDRKGPLH